MRAASFRRLIIGNNRRYFSNSAVFKAATYIDLTQPLARKPGTRLTKNKRRINITSPELCDDILSYIGPSLEELKGCDIIDINPGVCLWSSKLHDILKPRSHILIEPDTKQFRQHVTRLLSLPDSTYRHAELPTTVLKTYDNIFDEGYLPAQNAKPIGSSGSRQQNRTLLVTGVFARWMIERGLRFSSMALQMICKFCIAAGQGHLFQRNGPVRMLLWVADEEKSVILPRTVTEQKKSNMILNATYDIFEVAGTSDVEKQNRIGRNVRLNAESALTVLMRMRKEGLEIPQYRQDKWHSSALWRLQNPSEDFDLSTIDIRAGTAAISTQKLRELKELEQRFRNIDLESIPLDQKQNDRELRKYRYWTSIRNTLTKLDSDISSCADLAEEILHLEKQLSVKDNLTEKERADKEVDLSRLNMQHETARTDFSPNQYSRVVTEIDERISIKSGNPPLMWDSRPFEPLSVKAKEFEPAKSLSLLDFRPKFLSSDIDMERLLDFLQPLSLYMFSDLPRAMENLAPGASQLIREVPAITDPLRGGRRDPSDLIVRMLTSEMLVGLHHAFRRWPFRPPESDTMRYFSIRHNLNPNL